MEQDFDDCRVEERWCDERREQVAEYMRREGVVHGQIGESPAWHVAPYMSVWAVESNVRPGWVGWWVICGDLPTDHESAETIKHPRDAVRAFAESWLQAAADMEGGKQPEGFTIGTPGKEAALAPLLRARASMLLRWAGEDSLWEECGP